VTLRKNDSTEIKNLAALKELAAALAALAAAGVVQPGDPAYTFPPITPVPLQGQPLSEQILASRR
jgi:hypothetical protein